MDLHRSYLFYMEKHLAQKLVCRFSRKIRQDMKKRKITKKISNLQKSITNYEICLHLTSCPAFVQFHTDFSSKLSTSAFVVLLHWPSVLTHINEIKCLNLCSETTCLQDEVPLDS